MVYDRQAKGFRLSQQGTDDAMFTNDEILAICKILIDSRAFPKKTMYRLLDKMVRFCVPAVNRKLVNDLLSNERFHYIPPTHNTDVMDMMWTLGQAINE